MLKKCPFCGGEAANVFTVARNGKMYQKIICETCGAQTSMFEVLKGQKKTMAERAWNCRTESEEDDG